MQSPKRLKFDHKTVYFAIFVCAWTVVAMSAAQIVVFYPLSWLLGANFTKPFWTCIFYLLNYALSLALIILLPPRLVALYRKRHKNSSNTSASNPLATNATELGLQHLPTFVDIGLAPIGYVVSLVGTACLTRVMQLFPWFQAEQAQATGFTYLISTSDRLLAVLALVIIAPIVEEIILRGWLYGKLRSHIKAPLAILLVSVLFGFLHGQWNVAITTFVLSIVLCTLREITGTIWSGILLHMLSNGIAFYLLYVM